MLESDVLSYKISKNMPYNHNLKIVIAFVGLKYNIVRECIVSGKSLRKVNIGQTKKLICNKCFEYFKIQITLKQINYLLRPNRGKFPYTAIVIIETIYNLLEDEKNRYALFRNNKCTDYLDKNFYDDLSYEEFMIGKLPEQISNKADEFMQTNERQIFRCFIDTRDMFQEIFGETTFRECMEKFPIKKLTEKQIPKTMYAYQAERIYLKCRKGGK